MIFNDKYSLKIIFLLLSIALIIFANNFFLVSASNPGCCFDSSNGLCSANADQSSCVSSSGTFSSESSCSLVNECKPGCCVLGFSTSYITSRACELQSRSLGLQLNFQNIDELSCLSLANAEDIGACVMSGDYENLCSYGKRSACSGIFYKDKSCTDSSLDTICKPTEKTKCFGDSVYLIDSCGNQADLYQQCDYAQGTKCGKYSPGIDTRPDKGDYVCQDLNCEDGAGNARNNGERWCAGDVSSSFFVISPALPRP